MLLPEDLFGQLIPARDLPDGPVSEYRAKGLLADLGEPLTSKQVREFRNHGLVRPLPDGRYEPSVVNQLLAIKRTESYARPLARRTVFLRGDYFVFPVATDHLRQALVDLVPLIGQPARKLQRVARHGRSREGLRRRSRPRPPVKEWSGLLELAPLEILPSWAQGWYAMARDGIPSFYAPETSPIDDIPFEEQVLCLGVLDLDRRLRPSEGP